MYKGLIFGFRSHFYSPKISQEREQWFADFLQRNPDCTEKDTLNFHHFRGKDDIRIDIKINR